jgi:hypothetical protein
LDDAVRQLIAWGEQEISAGRAMAWSTLLNGSAADVDAKAA